MKIALAADHRGYNLKQELIENLKENYEIVDLGTDSEDSVDFPKFGILIGETIKNKEADLGIAICGTGIGISIAANKVKGVMCAKIDNLNDAVFAKHHNNANVLAFSANKTKEEALEMINAFLNTTYNGEEKYQRRIDEIKEYENAS